MRIVSLVPSTTETVAALGRAHDLVGVTTYCTVGAPDDAVRVGGTKNPSLAAVVALRPDVVLANTEENRPADLDELRAQGVQVLESLPKTVTQARDVVIQIGAALGADGEAAEIAAGIDAALAQARAAAPSRQVVAVTLIWRRPWMAIGPDTYADNLLAECGFANALTGYDERYPKLEPGLLLGADVVLLPSEPYAFTAQDLPAVAELIPGTPTRLVDGELLTWHGPRTAEGLRAYSALAAEVASALPA